jgi:1,2-phenylacetyl-CoA epoxidase PaaB subunit
MLYVWNVAARDSQGGIRAEFAVHASTTAGALKAAASNLTHRDDIYAVEVKNCGLSDAN